MGLAQTAGDNGPSTEAGGLGGTLSDIMGTTNHYHVSAPKLNAGNYQFQSDDPSQTGLNAQGLAGQGRGGVQVDTTGINRDYGYQNQSRNQGEQLISQLQDQAAGRGPSLATMQFNQNRDQSIMAGQSMANSARGGQNLGMSQYQAQVGAGQAMQQASAGSAAMRMQEQLSARQQLAGDRKSVV